MGSLLYLFFLLLFRGRGVLLYSFFCFHRGLLVDITFHFFLDERLKDNGCQALLIVTHIFRKPHFVPLCLGNRCMHTFSIYGGKDNVLLRIVALCCNTDALNLGIADIYLSRGYDIHPGIRMLGSQLIILLC